MVIAFAFIRFLDILDILLVAILLYQFYNILKGTMAMNIFIGIVSVFIVWQLVVALQMELLSKILGGFISLGSIALIVVFQPEIRKFLLFLGTRNAFRKIKNIFKLNRLGAETKRTLSVEVIVQACQAMGETNTGALIVLAKADNLLEYESTGVRIDAPISTTMLESIFFKNAPMHDGAVIIKNDKIIAARCVLPITGSFTLPASCGLRHRAGVGVTENCDAISVIVSEETGRLSYAKEGKLYLHVSIERLSEVLMREFTVVV